MAALSEDLDEDSELEFEDDEDADLIKKYRRVLNENQGDLAAGIENTAAVMGPLRKHQLLNKEDCEEVAAKVTTREQNETLISILLRRNAVKTFTVLVDTLWRVSPRLANQLQEVQSTIVWFASSPLHAAAIADTLEKHARVKLGAVQCEACYLCRTSRGRVFDRNDVRLWLVFPAKLADRKTTPTLVSDMVGSALSRIWPRATLAVMSGACDSVPGRVVPGQPVFVTGAMKPRSSSDGTSGDTSDTVGPTTADSEAVRHTFQQVEQAQSQPPWFVEVNHSHLEPSSLQYQSHWLARLYSEIRRVKDEEKSQWLESIDWDVANPALNKRHRSILNSKLPDWKNGRLVSVLLGNENLWRVDPTSPLGVSPSAVLLDRIDSDLRSDPNYLARLEARLSATPQFGVIAHQEEKTADQLSTGSCDWPPPETLGCDSDSFPFLECCRSSLDATCPRLVCKGVRYDMKEAETVCVATSTCWLVEAVKSLVQNRE